MRLLNVIGVPTAELAPAIESGDILTHPDKPFELSRQDQANLLGVQQANRAVHKNIAYRPESRRVTGLGNLDGEHRETVTRVLKKYSEWAVHFTAELLPQYSHDWRIDYTSFRGIEEQGRELPWKKRNDLLHTDAFPSRPTHGDLILRIFTNVNPQKDRTWIVSDPFPLIAEQYAVAAGLMRFAAQGGSLGGKIGGSLIRLARAAGLPAADRSPYDRFMLAFHDYLKANPDFQRRCAKYRFAFPPNSTWLVFTDVVPHSVISGQFALEQTLIVSRRSLSLPDQAPIAVLERLSHTRLAPSRTSASGA